MGGRQGTFADDVIYGRSLRSLELCFVGQKIKNEEPIVNNFEKRRIPILVIQILICGSKLEAPLIDQKNSLNLYGKVFSGYHPFPVISICYSRTLARTVSGNKQV